MPSLKKKYWRKSMNDASLGPILLVFPRSGNLYMGCPFCLTMMSDRVKTKNQEHEVKVYDLAELIAKDQGLG
jgi:hypothetical protein